MMWWLRKVRVERWCTFVGRNIICFLHRQKTSEKLYLAVWHTIFKARVIYICRKSCNRRKVRRKTAVGRFFCFRVTPGAFSKLLFGRKPYTVNTIVAYYKSRKKKSFCYATCFLYKRTCNVMKGLYIYTYNRET